MAVGWPMLQAGLSTILSVFCMVFVDSYMSEVFVKTIFLVVSLGFLHGLVVVPAVLAAFPTIGCKLKTGPSNDRTSVQTITKPKISSIAFFHKPSLRTLLFNNKIQPITEGANKIQPITDGADKDLSSRPSATL